jgi:hypothetical protein
MGRNLHDHIISLREGGRMDHTAPVPIQESEWSFMCVLGVSILLLLQQIFVIGLWNCSNDVINKKIYYCGLNREIDKQKM